jgi:hypothetical protein
MSDESNVYSEYVSFLTGEEKINFSEFRSKSSGRLRLKQTGLKVKEKALFALVNKDNENYSNIKKAFTITRKRKFSDL